MVIEWLWIVIDNSSTQSLNIWR